MNFGHILKHTQKIVTDNSPTILTAIGVTGTLTTAYLTGKATFKAAEILEERRELGRERTNDPEYQMTPRREIELVWKLYIPAAGVASTTIACIILANRIGNRRAAALAAAYSISEKAFAEYKEKVVEQIGKEKEQRVRDEIAQDRIKRASQDRDVVIVSEAGKVMCHDAFSNQFFMSDMETLRKAQNDVNQQILHSDYATVSDFYHYINAEGLEETSVSGEMGWNTDKFLECDFSTVLYQDKTPCISINFTIVPIRDPWRFC